MTVSFGWWLMPLTVTIVAVAWAGWIDIKPDPYRGSIGHVTATPFLWAAATTASLIAWLIWAVLT